MQYALRAFVEGRGQRVDAICRTFCSMERTAYSLLREGRSAGAVELLRHKGAYDRSPRTNFKLSHFMKREMLRTIELRALKTRMLSVEEDPAYSSKTALTRCGRRFGGFNRLQLAASVLARRAMGYGEAPAFDCLPGRGRKRRCGTAASDITVISPES
ncbi:MAG: hypothetical protein JRM91_04640 [Nitrososphaerota archaeon]|jgi:hypothetical protein|nr:hypothetical protein [Nitrososphaerota archaeon]MDG6945928.1 hypothetical protein [Nitrososphaerota archaeon]MDG6949599.1 hypothetical protein [Nitrososphaerota archaeon]